MTFPEGFLWGAATAAHQVEGNNIHSDWWEWEEKLAGKPGGPLEASGIACDSYNRYPEDFELASKLNHNSHRLSIEWARIEPEEGRIDESEIEHYRKVLTELKRRNMKTLVTLWHFSLPKWVRNKKGFGNLSIPKYMERYSKLIAERLGSEIDYFITLNEPVAYLALRHVAKIWIPSKRSSGLDFMEGWIGLLRAHSAMYAAIKKVNPAYKVGIVENVAFVEPASKTLFNKLIAELRQIIKCRLFLSMAAKKTDFIGLNYYFHDVIGTGELFLGMQAMTTGEEFSDWGWEIYPEGIYHAVKEVSRYGKPIYITENGIADAKDEKRESFIVRHLYWLGKAIKDGYDVRGYFYWSLLDNFEWADGYKRKFGLIEVLRDRNLERKVRDSAHTYARICRENSIGADLLQKYNLP